MESESKLPLVNQTVRILSPEALPEAVPEVFYKKGAAIFTGKHLFKSLLKEVAGLQDCNFINREIIPGVFLWILQIF